MISVAWKFTQLLHSFALASSILILRVGSAFPMLSSFERAATDFFVTRLARNPLKARRSDCKLALAVELGVGDRDLSCSVLVPLLA